MAQASNDRIALGPITWPAQNLQVFWRASSA